MKKQARHKAQIPNPALHPFARLIGEWETASTHPALPGKSLPGKSSFHWLEGGAFLGWHSDIEEKDFPAGTAIFGSDDATGAYFMLYFDERKVSRNYTVSVENKVITWWRDAPGFWQRCSWTIAEDANSIIGKGQLSKDGTTWESDLYQTFTRIE